MLCQLLILVSSALSSISWFFLLSLIGIIFMLFALFALWNNCCLGRWFKNSRTKGTGRNRRCCYVAAAAWRHSRSGNNKKLFCVAVGKNDQGEHCQIISSRLQCHLCFVVKDSSCCVGIVLNHPCSAGFYHSWNKGTASNCTRNLYFCVNVCQSGRIYLFSAGMLE